MKSRTTVITSALLCLTLLSIRPAIAQTDIMVSKSGMLNLRFIPRVNDRQLILNDPTPYINRHGDDFKVDIFKFYISNIILTSLDGRKVNLPDTYLLVNAEEPATLEQPVNGVPDGYYRSLQFTIGVDSLRNLSGAQTGALDPANGMFWSWNSGYIFLMMEGESNRSTAKRKRLTFHIGGSKEPLNNVRTFQQELPKTLTIDEKHQPIIEIAVNVATMFEGKHIIDFAQLNFTMGGPNSGLIADNYNEGLFKIINISQ